MKLYAWVGEDELGSGVVGIKQGVVPAGHIPLVSTERSKIDQPYILLQMQLQANHYGKTIRLAEFTMTEAALVTLTP